MGLLDDCDTYFGTRDLYNVLGISKEASDADLKKAYRKVSLLCHPDRVPEEKKEEATRKFQVLSKVHCILSDQEKRTVYDETGCIDEENANLEDKDWTTYWRLLFPKITKKSIDDFMKKYKGSDEEIEDLKRCYVQYEGDMDKISEAFIGYDADEEDKYREILKELIENKDIPDFPKFSKEKKAKKEARQKRFKKEESEAKVAEKDVEDSLANAIMKNSANRQAQFDDMMKNLEAKYCNKKSSSKRKK